MATSLALWSDHAQAPQREAGGARPGSQPTSEASSSQQKKRSSPNRIKARPANPAVITSILDSLDTLTRPSPHLPDEHESISERSSLRPYSADGTVRSMQTLTRSVSPGFGMEYGMGLSRVDDDDAGTDAALPPTIRTSRPPSGLSMYTAQRTPSFTGVSPAPPARTPSLRSRRSSYSSLTKEKTGYAKNKLSSESWVRQGQGQEAPESPTDTRERSVRSVRRVNSKESLRQAIASRETASGSSSPAADAPTISRAEQIIAKATTPPLSSSRRRLYLTDSASTEEQSVLTPPPIEEGPELNDEPLTPSPLYEPGDQLAVRRTSPGKNAIVDSIPMRTSSLRQSHSNSPVRGKKKEKKSSRTSDKGGKMMKKKKSRLDETSSSEEALAGRKVDSVVGASKTIPESSWADLGEEDVTVRRIRQLQEQRKSRLLSTHTSWSPEEGNAMANQMPVMTSPVPRPSEEIKLQQQMPRQRPATDRASTEPPVKAHKLLGLTAAENPSPLRAPGASPTSPARRRHLSLDEHRLDVRPGTSSLPTPPLSLDYSYADAVDALHGVEREISRGGVVKQQHTLQPSGRTSEQLPRISAQYPGTQVKLVPAETRSPDTSTSLRLTKSQRRKQQDRFSHHPDLPLEFERKKDRRKSTSDARNTRQYADIDGDMPLPMPRRDSIEIAVTEYLQHNRLSQKIRHPLTGRVISFSEVGDRNGAAVFVCVGMGLTRFVTAFYDELATTLRLRLITIDRPGVGGSEPYPPGDRSGPLNWPGDLHAVCDALDISKFSLVAHSAGAIYTLATALIMPHMVHGKIHLLAPWIPPSQLGAVSHSTASTPPAGALPRSQRLLRILPTTFLRAANSSFMTATSASLKPTTPRSRSRGPGDMNIRPATRDGGGADVTRRESMMLMDQFMPDQSDFPIPPTAAGAEDTNNLSRQPSVVMSATATPMDPSFSFAANALNAAEHTEKERRTEYSTRLTQRTWELAVRDSNPATDLLVCLERHREVGFRYTDVGCETVVTHGAEDKRVPVGNVRWLVEHMNRRARAEESGRRGGSELRVLEGEGHGLMASPVIMGDILTEVAGYWAKGR